jgi:hypothetical protein
MSEHFSRNTVSASFYCGRCKKFTQHRIDSGRKGPCLDCIEKYDLRPVLSHAPEPEPQQSFLFGVSHV